MEGNDKCKNP